MALADKQLGDARSTYSPSALGGAKESFSGWEPKKLWLTREGTTSEECAWAEGFDTRTDGRSLIASDLDGDGDVDLLLLNRNSPRLQLFRNDGLVGNAVTLRFEVGNVKVKIDGRAEEVLLQRGFASSVPPELTRGIGAAKRAKVEVTWRNGKTQQLEANAGITTITETKTSFVPFTRAPTKEPNRFPTTLESLGLPSGKRTLVTLFLAGCEPCRKEAPALNALTKKFTVIGLGIATDQDQASKIATSLGFNFDAKPIPDWVADALSNNGKLDFPTTLLFDETGRLERVLTDVTSLR